MVKRTLRFNFIFVSLLSLSSWAQNKGMTFQATIKDPSGALVSATGLTVNAKVLSSNRCILREENFTGVQITNGYVSLSITKGVVTGSDPGLTVRKVFDNSSAISSLVCINADGSTNGAVTSYTPTVGDVRKLRISFSYGGTPIAAEFNMRSTPFAVNAETLNGRDDTGYVQTSANITQANVESIFSRYTKLDSILSNTNASGTTIGANITGNAATATTATNVTGVVAIANGGTGAITQPAAINALLPSQASNAGKLLQTDGTDVTWINASGGGTITGVTAGTGLTGGGTSGGITLSLSNIPANSILSNVTGATAAPVGNTISQVLDTYSSTQGSVLYRSATGWAGLGAGTSGDFLKTQGAGANPLWAPASVTGFTGSLLGDVTGPQAATVVEKLKGTPISYSGLATGNFLRYDGTNWTNANLVLADIPNLDFSQITTGTLGVARGGTGASSLGSGNILIGGGVGAVTSLAAGALGNVVYGTGVSTWASGSPDTAGLVDKSSVQSISGAKTFTTTLKMANQNILAFGDSGSNAVNIKAPATISTSYTLTLPTAQGAASSYLTNDGSGNLSWAAGATGLPAGAGNALSPGYTFSGNLNTGMFGAATNQIGFSTNGVERVRIDASGNVGIGTSTPQSLLQVNGGVQIANDAAACVAGKAGTMKYTGGNLYFCDGTTWQVVAVSGSGLASLNGQTGASQIFANAISGTTPTFVSASNTHTLNIPMANTASVTAGLISKSEYDAFNNKLGTSTALVGDVSGTYSTTSVDKLKGTALSITALTSGNFLKYNGTNWINTNLAASDIPNLDVSQITTGTLPVARGGTGATTLASGSLIVGNGTGAVGSLAAGSAGNVVYASGVSTWASGTPDAAGLVDKTSVQSISGAKTFGATVKIANQNNLVFGDGAANTVSFKAPAAVTTSYSLVWPTAQGGATTFLKNDGTGNLSWVPGGTVTNVTATAPLSVTSGTTTPWLTISTASSSSAGALTASDWTTFNAKLSTTTNFVGDVSGTSSTMSVDKLKGVGLSISALTTGNFLKYNGTNWVNVTPSSADLSNNSDLLKASSMPASCSASQTLTFASPSGAWSCTNITGLNASVITAGTISGSVLPASATYWQAATGGINYSGGNVGIGNSTPGYKLDVAGSIKATSFISTSDRRLKTNIRPLENSWGLLSKLQGVRFDWIKDGRPEIGLIAQEVEKVFPELVATDPQSGLKAVKYQGLISPLIEVAKQTSGQLENLEAQIPTLESENAELEKKIKLLDRRLQSLEESTHNH